MLRRSSFFVPTLKSPTSSCILFFSAITNCSSVSPFFKISGPNSHLPVRSIAVSRTSFSDIVGENNTSSALARPERIAAGDLLALTDACAAQAAARHVFGPHGARIAKDSNSSSASSEKTEQPVASSVTTVAFQEIKLATPVMSGDFLNLTGEVVNVGGSSLDVHVSVEKMQFPTVPGEQRRVHVADAFASFVAIGKDLRPVKVVPRLGHEDEKSVLKSERAQYLKQLNQRRMKEEAEIESMTMEECKVAANQMHQEIRDLFKDTAHEAEHEKYISESSSSSSVFNSKPPSVPMAAATLEAHRFFLQGFQNMHSSIFGGEILRWMEKHAVYLGRRFACNFEVHTLAMHSVQFHEPIFYTDAVSLRARVVNLRNTTMEVDVEVFVDRADGRHLTSNCASFVLVSLSNFGKPRPIGIDLDFSNASLEESVAHAKAMKRYVGLAKCRTYDKITKQK
jgi:acyl-CoA hydrolase